MEMITHFKSAVKIVCTVFKKNTLSFVIFQEVSLKEKEPEQISITLPNLKAHCMEFRD